MKSLTLLLLFFSSSLLFLLLVTSVVSFSHSLQEHATIVFLLLIAHAERACAELLSNTSPYSITIMVGGMRFVVVLKSICGILVVLFLYNTISFQSSYDTVGKAYHHVGKALDPMGVSLPSLPAKLCAPIDTATLRNIRGESPFTDEITYWKRYIRSTPSLRELPSFTVVNETLLPPSARFHIAAAELKEDNLEAPCLPALELPTTKSRPTGDVDLTPLIIGISTSMKRLRTNTIEHFGRFLTRPISTDHQIRASNGAGFLVHLNEVSDEELKEAEDMFKTANISALVKRASDMETMAERYLSLIPSLLEESKVDAEKGKKRTWLVLVDDDSFFPRPHALLKKLEEMFPNAETEEVYAGCWREILYDRHPDYTQLQGGAGIFLTIPLAERMLDPVHDIPADLLGEEHNPQRIPAHRIEAGKANYLDLCLEMYKWEYNGDVRLSQCMHDLPHIQGVNVPGLHQMDMFGDLSGFYESGGPFLSTHHWKSWGWHYPNRQSAASDVCGEDCIFQRWAFTHPIEDILTDDLEKEELWPIILSNGYSIAEYEPATFKAMDLQMAEATFNDFYTPLFNMDYGVGNGQAMREKIAPENKKQWRLLESKPSAENPAWRSQWYGLHVKKDDKDFVEKIAELVWVAQNHK